MSCGFRGLRDLGSKVIDQLFERLTSLSNLFESAVELSSSLQAQHITAQSTIFTYALI
jgi:hypothetical protein